MKSMKIKLLLLLSAVCFSVEINAQSLLQKFEKNKDITTVVVSQKMFQMLSKIETKDADAKEFMQVANKLTGMKVFSTESKAAIAQMKQEVESYVKAAALGELMRVKDKASNVKIYTKGGKDVNHASELLMLIEEAQGGKQTVVLSLTGDIDLQKVGVLTKNMNLPKEVNDIR